MIILRKQKEYSTALARGLAGFNKNILRKSPMQAKRAAIIEERKILTPIAKPALKLSNSIENNKYLTPGQFVSKGISATIKNPIAVSTNVVGKVTMATDPLGVGAIPLGSIGTAGEVALKKFSPRYGKITKNLGEKYDNSKGRRYVESISNGIIHGLNGIM